MSKKHLVFVINPKSGVDREKAIQQTIDSTLDMNQYSYEIAHTQYAKHGTALAKEAAAKNAHAVVAVGGDGSVNDIMAGLIGTQTALAILPKGSGNGTARTLGIPLEMQKAIEVINGGNSIMMDIGFANNKPFIINAGVAFDALIADRFSKSKRRGFIAYSWLVTKHLWTYKEPTWNVTIDGKEYKERAFIISVANAKQFGYNFQIAPEADWTDGTFDVVIIKKFPKILGGLLVMRAMNGTITKSPYVKHIRGKNITISHPELSMMQADGDAFSCEPKINFRIEQGLQKVIVP